MEDPSVGCLTRVEPMDTILDDDVAPFLQSICAGVEHLGVLLIHEDGGRVLIDLQREDSFTERCRWMSWHLERIWMVGWDARDHDASRGAYECQARSAGIDSIRIVRPERAERSTDVLLREAELLPEIDQGFWLDASSAQRAQRVGRRASSHPSNLPFAMSSRIFAGREGSELMDLDSAPVQRDRVGPAKMLVQQHLLPRAVHEVLATDDVGDALFMILDGGLEVEQWPDLVPGTDLWPRVRIPIGVLDAQGRPIPKCRIRQVHRRSNSHHSFAGAEPPFDHLLPICVGVLDGAVPARACRFRFPVPPERVCRASAHVRSALLQQCLGMRMVDLHTVACEHDPVRR